MTGVVPRRILHVAPSLGVGGREIRMALLIDALGDAFSHDLVALDGNTTFLQRVQHRHRCTAVPVVTSGPLGTLRAIRALIRRRRPSILATYNWGAIDAVAAGLLCRHPGIIHTEDGFGSEESTRLLTRRVLARRVLLPRCRAVVMISRTLAEIARTRYHVPASRLHYIANGVDADRFRPGLSTDWRQTLGIPAGTLLLGTVGRLSAEKNFGMMLRALAALGRTDVHLAIVGGGPCAESLRSLRDELGLAGRVHIVGPLADTAACHASFDAFLLTSSTEQLPLALLEAMACGKPALATDVGDCRHVLPVVDGFSPVVSAGSLPQFVGRLQQVVADAALRERVGRANRDAIVKSFGLQVMVERYQGLYDDVAARDPGRLAAARDQRQTDGA